MKENNETINKVCEQIDKKIEALEKEKIQQTNIDYLNKLMDFKYKVAKVNHMKKEDENMMYSNYGNYDDYGNYGRDAYGRNYQRDSRGRFMGNDNYGRRYRGHDAIEDMSAYYGTYMENKENGRYGSPETSKALDYMLKSVEEFIMTLKNDAQSQEEIEKIRKTARKIAENV